MARLTRKDLKSIFKECLKEILLEEGFLTSGNNIINKAKNSSSSLVKESIDNKSKTIDKPARIENEMLLENIHLLANTIGGENKNIYAEILADTAMSTYQQQHEVGVKGTILESSFIEKEEKKDSEALHALADKFAGGDMSHWANLAFAKK